MKKVLPVLLMLIGIAEIVLGVMDVKPPIPVTLFPGVLFIGVGIKALMDARQTK